MKIRLLLFGNKESCSQVQSVLRDDEISVVGSIGSENMALDEISNSGADMVLVLDTSPMSLRVCHQIYLLRPRTIPVIISDSQDSVLMERIMQSGVHYVIPQSVEPFELISELKGIHSNENNRIMSLENSGTASNKSKVIMLYAAKDGFGRTTLAVNLAIRLAQRKNKVAILDYNMQFGDVANYLGINSKNSIVELLQEQSNPNADTIRQFLSIHLSGVSILPAPFNPEDARAVSPVQAERIISALRVYYDYIIIDSASGFDDINAACMEISSQILVLTSTDVPALRNTKKSLTIMRALTDEDKLRLVVRGSQLQIKDSEVERVLGMSVWEHFAEDLKASIQAANQGIPVVTANGKSKLAKNVTDMANKLDYTAVENKTKKLGIGVFGK